MRFRVTLVEKRMIQRASLQIHEIKSKVENADSVINCLYILVASVVLSGLCFREWFAQFKFRLPGLLKLALLLGNSPPVY